MRLTDDIAVPVCDFDLYCFYFIIIIIQIIYVRSTLHN